MAANLNFPITREQIKGYLSNELILHLRVYGMLDAVVDALFYKVTTKPEYITIGDKFENYGTYKINDTYGIDKHVIKNNQVTSVTFCGKEYPTKWKIYERLPKTA